MNDDREAPGESPEDIDALTRGSKSRLQGADTRLGKDGGTANLKERIQASLDAKPGAKPDPGNSEPDDPFINQIFLGKYLIEKKLGEGGMGAVYKAYQEGIDRHVAIKVLSERQNDSELSSKRFHVEAMAVSRLDHPHTIRIYDFGRTDDGVLFIVMELLQGQALNDLLRSRRELPVALALKILREIAESLREAHEKGIVHRDLKPENVFLVQVDDDAHYAKVLDFGVAKMTEGHKDGTLTQAGMVFGTPRYMSPEQATAEQIDGRSDLYALGCMLHEMLCGRPPFEAETPIALLFKHVHDQPKPFEEARPDLVIPPEIEQITRRLLEKRPQDRFGSMKALLDALDTAVSRLPSEFGEVVSRDAAEAAELLERLGQATSAPATLLEPELVRTQRRSPSELWQQPKAKARGWTALMIAGIALLGASAIAGYQAYASWTAVEELPAGLLPIFEEGLGVSPEATLPENEDIRLTIRSQPAGATARIGDRRLGTTPLTWHTLKDASDSAVVVLELKGYHPYATDLRLEGNQVIDVQMEEQGAPEAPGTRKRPAKEKAAAKSAAAAPTPKVIVTKKPVEFKPGKVRDTKKNPYQ